MKEYHKIETLFERAMDGSKWIRVEDSLPELNGWYLCYLSASSISGKDVWKTQTLYWEDREWLYHPNSFKMAWNVTHWMPLPDPPKEG